MPQPAAQPIKPSRPGSPVGVSVIIPMYREAARINQTLRDAIPLLAAAEQFAEIVLVDDGSPDDTVARVTPALTDTPEGSLRAVRLIRHEHNRGKGAAVRTGLAAAVGTWRLIMDADNAATVRELPKLLATAKPGVGLVAGSRVAQGALVDAVPGRRFAGSVFKLALHLLGLDLLADTQCGFKLYRADLAEQVAAHGCEDGYAFDLEHLLITQAAGLRAVEVGIAWTHKAGGQVSPVIDGLRMLRRAAAIRARRSEIKSSTTPLPSTLPERDEPPVVVTVPEAFPSSQPRKARQPAS
ncbi:MAG: glycosyltransferase [Planctomycetota bacterium]|nr:glycosyltransferase [Planctomycetota bacterium]